MQLDTKICIATGLKASSRSWKNTNTTWLELVERLREPVITNETFSQYQNAPRSERGKIKDVGGYVGGYLRGGRRKPDRVAHRQVITLDLDFATLDVWEDITLILEEAVVLHSTHSHSEETPKYRLIMPLDREVSPDEYVAISRRVAGLIGIDLFDSTGFQPYRLMFWPSISKDAEYEFHHQEGPLLSADGMLATYIDWRDSSLWPTSGAQLDEIGAQVAKQQDPTEKRGLVGAFCRTYSITEAIDAFLSDSYERVTDERYTYLKGSTAGGLIIYEDKFAYSHHGTDPISGTLCNAFDLVRVHLYGHFDDGNVKNPIKKKSYQMVSDMISEDALTKRTLAQERVGNALADFGVDFKPQVVQVDHSEETPYTEDNLEWVEDLEVDSKGNYRSSATNFSLILQHDPAIGGRFSMNRFDGKQYLTAPMPWRELEKTADPLKNVDYSGLRSYVERAYGITNSTKLIDALVLESEKKSMHPIREYISGLKWDGEERIERFLIDYFGADDTIYVREATKKTFLGAVSRVFRPGCKFDLVLVLVGEQGTGKSTIVRKLGGPWYSDTFVGVTGKESFEQVQGAWVIEMAELAGLRKAEVEAVKHFITKQEDTFRPAYARTSEQFPRQCIFIGTTNRWDFLRDPTGNRRFMPVDGVRERIKKSIHDIAEEEVDQMWAEAYQYFKNGETLYLSQDAEVLARVEQFKHSETDERRGLILNYLNTKLPTNWAELGLGERRMFLTAEEDQEEGTVTRDRVTVAEIWCECLGNDRKDMQPFKTQGINAILRTLRGWEDSKKSKRIAIYGKQRYYQRQIL